MSSRAIESASFETLLEQGHLDELLWLQARSNRRRSGPSLEHALYAGIAAHHLGLREPARAHLSSWARVGGHLETGPLVSFILSDEHGPEALRSSLDQVVGQIYRPIEIVVVTAEGSSQAVLTGFADRVPIRQVKTERAERWRELGAQAASGRWISWLDHRTELYPHHVGHLVAFVADSGQRAVRGSAHTRERGLIDAAPRLRTLESRSVGRYEALTDDETPFGSLLVDADLARRAVEKAAPSAWSILIELSREAPIEASGVVTICVDHDLDPEPAAVKLRRYASIYQEHLPQTIRLGGASLHQRQKATIRRLLIQAEAEATRTRVVIALVVRRPDRLEASVMAIEAATAAFRKPGDRVAGQGPEIVPVDPDRPDAFRQFHAWCVGSSFDYVAVVEDAEVSSLEPGWLTSAVIHLAANPTLVAAAPTRPASQDPADALFISGWHVRKEPHLGPVLVVSRQRVSQSRVPKAGVVWSEAWKALFDLEREAADPVGSVLVLPPSPTPAVRPAERPEPPLVVLCYHRVVVERSNDPFDIAVSQQTFAAHLDRLARDYRVVTADEVQRGALDHHTDDPRVRVLITIDDGYRDTYEVAAPLLFKKNLPFVVFVTTGAIDKTHPFWWEALIRSRGFASCSPETSARTQEELRFLAPDERERRIESLELDAAARAECEDLAATWAMLRELHRGDLATLGAHTRSHSSLGRLDDATLAHEVSGSFSDLEAAIGVRPTWFAFPHGSASDLSVDAVDALLSEGCALAFTTIPGSVRMSALAPGSREAMTLPRVVVGEIDADTLTERIEAHAPLDPQSVGAPKKIVVLSGITARNIGDDAMLVATVDDLKRLDPDVDIVVLAEEPEACDPVQKQIGVPIARSLQGFIQAFLRELPESTSPVVELARLIRRLQDDGKAVLRGEASGLLPDAYVPGFKHLLSADGVVDCGGANLSAHWKSYFYEKCVDYFLSAKPLFVLGQGIDRFEDPGDLELLTRALSQANEVTLREHESEKYLSTLGHTENVRTTADDALTIVAAPVPRREFLLRVAGHDPKEPYLAFQFRHYLDYEDERYLTLFALFVDEAIRATGLPVVGVPMHFSHTDERRHLAAVFARAQEKDRTHIIPCELTASDAKSLFGGSKLTFGISYHSAVLSLSAGTPFMGLFHGAHYEQKMKGLAALYELPSLAVSIHQVLPSELGIRVLEQIRDRSETVVHLRRKHAELEAAVVDSRRRFLDAVTASKHPPESVIEPALPLPFLPLEPLSRDWGFDRGLPVDRFYIERFLSANRAAIRGHVAELLNDTYARRFGGDDVVGVDIIDIDPANPNATVLADLTAPKSIGSDRFDCFILTQTLPYIHDCGAALQTAFTALKPKGTLLVTVPSIIKYHREPEDHWRFTPDSLTRLVEDHCPGARCTIESHGNLMAAVAFLTGMATQELDADRLLVRDEEYPVVITARIERLS